MRKLLLTAALIFTAPAASAQQPGSITWSMFAARPPGDGSVVQALGYRDFSADDLVSMRIHGVTAEYVGSLQRAGMAHLSADQLVRLRLAGFDASKR